MKKALNKITPLKIILWSILISIVSLALSSMGYWGACLSAFPISTMLMLVVTYSSIQRWNILIPDKKEYMIENIMVWDEKILQESRLKMIVSGLLFSLLVSVIFGLAIGSIFRVASCFSPSNILWGYYYGIWVFIATVCFWGGLMLHYCIFLCRFYKVFANLLSVQGSYFHQNWRLILPLYILSCILTIPILLFVSVSFWKNVYLSRTLNNALVVVDFVFITIVMTSISLLIVRLICSTMYGWDTDFDL